jgi:hypothetical protein
VTDQHIVNVVVLVLLVFLLVRVMILESRNRK